MDLGLCAGTVMKAAGVRGPNKPPTVRTLGVVSQISQATCAFSHVSSAMPRRRAKNQPVCEKRGLYRVVEWGALLCWTIFVAAPVKRAIFGSGLTMRRGTCDHNNFRKMPIFNTCGRRTADVRQVVAQTRDVVASSGTF